MEVLMGKPSINGPFPMAMLNNQRADLPSGNQTWQCKSPNWPWSCVAFKIIEPYGGCSSTPGLTIPVYYSIYISIYIYIYTVYIMIYPLNPTHIP
jgi:hypothetical protein